MDHTSHNVTATKGWSPLSLDNFTVSRVEVIVHVLHRLKASERSSGGTLKVLVYWMHLQKVITAIVIVKCYEFSLSLYRSVGWSL